MSWDSKTMPSSCEARDFFPEQTIAQIGIGNIFGISGGRVGHLSKNGEVIGIELPVGHGYKVRVFLDADDTYVVQRVWRETVKGVATGVYCDEIGEVAYQAGMYRSNRDWGDS